ncbi:MAG: PLDc N-terminal domain-containing protein, partial [Duncaniella sp.]|nr:PLDc N-terminal domain-containing protein [Duncaniella sp.]
MSVLTWAFVIAYAILIVMLIVAVLSDNRNPLKALGWVTALILFPIGGAILYFVFGRSMRNVKMISRRNRRKLLNAESHRPLPKLSKSLSPENRQRIMVGYSVAEALVYPDNTVEVVNEGRAMFDSLFADLRTARKYINLQFYIIANDFLGRELAKILIERAHAGVKIRVIYDYVGSFGSHTQKLFNRLRSHGIEVHSFFRIQFPEKLGRLNWRNHRKAVIIDGRIGYIGGINVAQRYVDGGTFGVWRDMAARITGPGVAALQHNFAI